ncbi:cytochrome P450 [Xylariaceae sp. FL0662B]|nr:cytochrome P450 [Xylariaceae sp. FL0662B]
MLYQLLRVVDYITTSEVGLILIGCIGVSMHRFYFIHGEHHLQVTTYLKFWLFASTFVSILAYLTNRFNIPSSNYETGIYLFKTLFLLNSTFFASLFGSITAYRVFQHPLKDFAGPRLAAISKLWHVYHMFTTPNFLFLDDLYRKYGSIVRTGPQELTIVDPDVWKSIGGPGTTCIRSPWYDLMFPYMSLASFRTKDGYSLRRKRWDEAFGFSGDCLPNKHSRVHHFATSLMRRIDESACTPVNVTTWFYYFAFDVISDLTFGRPLSLVANLNSNIKPHYAPSLISQGMSMFRWFTPAPWLGHLCFALAPYMPLVTQKWNRIFKWTAEVCDDHLERNIGAGNGTENISTHLENQADAFSYFIRSARREDDSESLDHLALYGDTFAVAIAGTHTTSAVLTMLYYVLAQRPELQDEVRREIIIAGVVNKAFGIRGARLKEEIDMEALDKLPLMDACINETMRIYSPLPSGGARQTVDTGIWIGDKWIPPHTVVVAPRWSIGRLESAFERPTEFIPERWTTKPHMVKDIRAFNAFGTGRHSCPGKQLGLLKIRMVAAMTLANFEFTFAPTKNNKIRAVRDTQDAFLALPGDLELIFKPLESHET